MTQYQLTLDSETLQRLFMGDDQVGHLLVAALNQVLNAQVTEQLQAAPYERSEQRPVLVRRPRMRASPHPQRDYDRWHEEWRWRLTPTLLTTILSACASLATIARFAQTLLGWLAHLRLP